MLDALEDMLSRLNKEVWLLIPYEKSSVINLLHEQAIVQEKLYEPEGVRVRALLTPILTGQLEAYIIREEMDA